MKLAIGVGLFLTACLLVHGLMRGAVEGSSFASREETPYVLPWAVGEAHFCVQGNRSLVTHQGQHAAAWDFTMWPGTAILAARAGVVETVVADAPDYPNLEAGNHLTVRHADGSLATYAHVTGGSLRVLPGDEVAQREHLAGAGMSGMTAYPHLHFFVLDRKGLPVPVSFREVPGDGIPRVWHAYTAH